MTRSSAVNSTFWPGKLAGLVQSISLLTYHLIKQKNFLSRHILSLLSEARSINDGGLGESDVKKITHYYGLAVPAILGEAFCTRMGRAMTTKERWASTCQGAMTGLFDDFFDKEYLDAHVIASKIFNQHKPVITERSNEKLFTQFYEKALASVTDPALMREALLTVHKAQVESRRQNDETLSLAELWNITEEKGGTSLLFYRTAFNPPPSTEERNALYHLGATMQLANDIFDVYKDREQKIRTLMTETESVDKIRQLLLQRLADGYALAYALPVSRGRTKRFLSFLSIGIFSRCFVCLDHLEQNEKQTDGKFIVNAYTRKQLICDMDTKKNMLRSAAYHIKTFA